MDERLNNAGGKKPVRERVCNLRFACHKGQ